jgi:hypothetical protein
MTEKVCIKKVKVKLSYTNVGETQKCDFVENTDDTVLSEVNTL